MSRSSAGPLRLSVLAALLAVVTSLAGVLDPRTYARETPAWAVQAIGQDLANLAVAVLLIACVIRMRGGSGNAVLVWLGGLLYLIYAFAIYAFDLHFNRWFLAYVAVLGLSLYAFIWGLAARDPATPASALRNHPQRRGAASLLVAIGVLFALLWLSDIVPHLSAAAPPPSLVETGLLTNPVHVLDLAFVLPAMIVTGVLLWRGQPAGLLFAVPLLVFAVTMGVGILALFGLSVRRGIPVAAAPAVIVAVIVVASAFFVWRLTRTTVHRQRT